VLECLIIGDSIAAGIAQAKPECVAIVRSGITTQNWFDKFNKNPNYTKPYKVAVISLSTNDMYNSYTSEYLYNVRYRISAEMVIWILPNSIRKPTQYQIVKEIAKEFEDKILDINQWTGPDGIHPPTMQAYRLIVNKIF
jgi:hypothetical protein